MCFPGECDLQNLLPAFSVLLAWLVEGFRKVKKSTRGGGCVVADIDLVSLTLGTRCVCGKG